MADIINLADYRSPGNGAPQIVQKYFEDFPSNGPIGDLIRADHFLIWLWGEGYKVVPVDDSDT